MTDWEWDLRVPSTVQIVNSLRLYTDKKENQIFLIYKEIQSGGVAKSYTYEEGLPNIWGNAQIFPYIWGLKRPLVIYDFAAAPF